MTETYIELEGLLSSSILNKEERERISALIADKLDQEQRMLNEMCTEIASFIELSKNGFFKTNKMLLFKEFLSSKFSSAYKKIYVQNLDNIYNLFRLGLGEHMKAQRMKTDISIQFFSDETVMNIAKIYLNSIVQKVEYDSKSMEMTVTLIIMDRNLITWQGCDLLNLNREIKLCGKIIEEKKMLYVSINEPKHIFESIYIPLVMKDDTVPISFILRDSLEAALRF